MKVWISTFLMYLATAAFAYGDEPPLTANAAAPPPVSTISGQVMLNDKKPMTNGVVFLFNKGMGPPPHPYKYWRIPDQISGTDNNGMFSIEVGEGTYYLMIAQKNPNSEIGPVNEKEFLYFHGDREGSAQPIVVLPGVKVALGVLTGTFVFTPDMVQHDKGITAIEGVVTDMKGKPAEKAIVFAYLSQGAVGRPAFVSERTDQKGRFQLRVNDGGTYYLIVRSVIGGGKPEDGEFLNTTREFQALAVSLKRDQIVKGVILKGDRLSRGAAAADQANSAGTARPKAAWKDITQQTTH